MSNILVQFPEIQQAINQAGTGSVTIGPPTFKKSTVELTELVSDSTGIHLNYWGWGSNQLQKKDFAQAFKLNSDFGAGLFTSDVFATMDGQTSYYYNTDQTIGNLGVVGNASTNTERCLISFNLNRYFYFGNYDSSGTIVTKTPPKLPKNGGGES